MVAPRRTLLFVSAVLLSILSAALLAGVFVYYPYSTSMKPVPPPIVYVDPGSPYTTVQLGPNAASAEVVAKAQAGTWEITYNGGFDDNPDGWYFSPGTYLSNAAWYSSVSDGSTTKYGVIGIYGYMTGTSDQAAILQYVTVPNTSATFTAQVTVFGYATSGIYILYYYVGLYDPDTSSSVWSSSGIATRSWQTQTFTVSASLTPGKTYIFYFLAYPYHISWFGSGTVYYFIDELRLYATVSNPYYTNVFVDANVTDGQTYQSMLVLRRLVYSGTPNVTVKLVNVSNVESTAITISSGTVVSDRTSWIVTPPASSGYTSLRFHVDASINSGGYVNMTFTYIYKIGGVVVEYPLQLNITDPPPGNITLPPIHPRPRHPPRVKLSSILRSMLMRGLRPVALSKVKIFVAPGNS